MADEIETDVQVTADGVFVISHDDQLDSRCDWTGRYIHRLTYAEVKSVRCDGEPIPLVDDVLTLVAQHPGRQLRIEVKGRPGLSQRAEKEIAVELTRMIEDAGITKQTVVQSFQWRFLAEPIKEAGTGVRVGALDTKATYGGVTLAHQLGLTDYVVRKQYIDLGLIQYARHLGLRTGVWGINSGSEYGQLKGLGGMIAIMDDPDLAVDAGHRCASQSLPTSTLVLPTATLRYDEFIDLQVVESRQGVQSVTVRLEAVAYEPTNIRLSLTPTGSPINRERITGGGRPRLMRDVTTLPGDDGKLRLTSTASSPVAVSIMLTNITRFECD